MCKGYTPESKQDPPFVRLFKFGLVGRGFWDRVTSFSIIRKVPVKGYDREKGKKEPRQMDPCRLVLVFMSFSVIVLKIPETLPTPSRSSTLVGRYPET